MRTSPALLALALLAGTAACSGDDDSAAPTPGPTSASPSATGTGTGTEHVIRAVRGNSFNPDALTLAVGDSVKVDDVDGDAPHNFVVDGVGRSGTLQEGDTFTLRFGKAGTYRFVCTFHEAQGMDGTITVR